MKRLCYAILCCTLVSACCTTPESNPLDDWSVECNHDSTELNMLSDTLEIISPDGNTVWYNQKLTGEYTISYKAEVLDEGGRYDRLSDLNCFWGAKDHQYPDDLMARSAWRNGIFKNYNTMDLFYVGFGGNENKTTRFRKYNGEFYGVDDSKIKPVIKEYSELPNLLEKDHWYDILITVGADKTEFTIDGRTIFSKDIVPGECDGHFGLRFWMNHVLVKDFKVTVK